MHALFALIVQVPVYMNGHRSHTLLLLVPDWVTVFFRQEYKKLQTVDNEQLVINNKLYRVNIWRNNYVCWKSQNFQNLPAFFPPKKLVFS